ncbi:MAG: FHA domain-containing protein [Myxococcota bacterium]
MSAHGLPRALPALALAIVASAIARAADDGAFALRKVERLFLDDVVPAPDGARTVELYLRAETSIGEPVDDLRPVDIEIVDAGERIAADDLELRALGATTHGVACALAIDVSASIDADAFARARTGALDLLDDLGEFDRVAVVAFGDEVEDVASFDAPRADARAALEQLAQRAGPSGPAERKRLFDALEHALGAVRARRDLPRRSFLVVFSDGADVGSAATADVVAELAHGSAGDARTPIFAIGLGSGSAADLSALRHVAKRTQASFFQASSSVYLPDFFASVLRQMKQSYVVRYPADLDGAAHEVVVRVEGQSATRVASYPEVGGPWWPWAVGVALAGGGIGAFAWAKGSASQLRIESGPRKGERLPLRARTTRIGALADNDLVLESPAVSRYHARIYRRGRSLEIEDCASSNGTLVNGNRVKTATLRPGDRIRIADIELRVEA